MRNRGHLVGQAPENGATSTGVNRRRCLSADVLREAKKAVRIACEMVIGRRLDAPHVLAARKEAQNKMFVGNLSKVVGEYDPTGGDEQESGDIGEDEIDPRLLAAFREEPATVKNWIAEALREANRVAYDPPDEAGGTDSKRHPAG